MVKNNKPRSSIFLKLFIPTVTTVSILGSCLSYISYHDQKKNMINDRIQASQLIASVATTVINGDDVASVKTADDTNKVVYNKIITQFNMINEDKQLKDIYSIYFKDNNVYYGMVNSDSEEIATGYVVKHLTEKYSQLIGLSDNKILSDDTITYNDYNEPIISSYAPLFNSANELIGAIACEYDASIIIKELHKLSYQLAFITVFSTIFTSILLTFIIQSILKKLKLISLKLEEMSTDAGDLTAEIIMNSHDEVGLFSLHINKLVRYIRKIFLAIRNHIKTIDTSVKDAYIGISEADDNIVETDTKLHNINNSVANMTFSIDNIDHASVDILKTISSSNYQLSDGINYALSIKEHARQTSEKALQKQIKATKSISVLSATLSEKLEISKDITKITDLAKDIIDITDETNLLAINASIKAARAGMQGKGFLVVADQLGSLAITTEASAKQIDDASGYVINSVKSLANSIQEMLDFINDLSNESLTSEINKCITDDMPSLKKITNNEGQVKFENLELGLYLVKQTNNVLGYSNIDPFLVNIPKDMDNKWVYDIKALPKTDIIRLMDITVEKKWDIVGSENTPSSVIIELLKNNVLKLCEG